jgi:hypothetical protein
MKRLAVFILTLLFCLIAVLSYAWFYCIYFRLLEGLPFHTYAWQLVALFFCQGAAFVLFILIFKTVKK